MADPEGSRLVRRHRRAAGHGSTSRGPHRTRRAWNQRSADIGLREHMPGARSGRPALCGRFDFSDLRKALDALQRSACAGPASTIAISLMRRFGKGCLPAVTSSATSSVAPANRPRREDRLYPEYGSERPLPPPHHRLSWKPGPKYVLTGFPRSSRLLRSHSSLRAFRAPSSRRSINIRASFMRASLRLACCDR